MNFTIWDVFVIVAFLGLPYAGPALLVAGVLLLAVPGSRRRAGLRWTAYGLLAVDVGLLVVAAPMLVSVAEQFRHDRAFDARTHVLKAAQTYGGTAFPAGSTVHVGEDGRPEFGTLSSPTRILGFVLTGAFRLGSDHGLDPVGVLDGTLAEPADVGGIPCGPGRLMAQANTTRCVLTRDHVFAGHVLAAGTALEVYRSPLDDPPLLTFGVLAAPELLYDVTWPAGTVMGGVRETPQRMAHEPAAENQAAEFCLPSGKVAEIPGAVLHGFLAYNVLQEGRRMVSPVCSIVPQDQERVGRDGYAQVGEDRYSWGERAGAGAPWRWTTRFEPRAE